MSQGFRSAGRTLLAVIAMAILASGCADRRGGPVPYNPSSFVAPDATGPLELSEKYRVAPGDTLTVQVYRVADLSGDVVVDGTGAFNMPLIGRVEATGKTTDELASDLTTRFGEKYLQSPQVQVVVKAIHSDKITVDGAVAQPGVFPVTGKITLVQAIALARGTTPDANPRRVVVFRYIDGQRNAASFDLTDIRRGVEGDPDIFGNDIIVVDSNTARARFKDIISAVPLVALFRPF